MRFKVSGANRYTTGPSYALESAALFLDPYTQFYSEEKLNKIQGLSEILTQILRFKVSGAANRYTTGPYNYIHSLPVGLQQSAVGYEFLRFLTHLRTVEDVLDVHHRRLQLHNYSGGGGTFFHREI